MSVFAQTSCLNLNYSEISGLTAVIFSGLVHNCALQQLLTWNPRHVAPFLGGNLLKTQHSPKFAIFQPLYTKCVRVWWP